MRDYRSPRNGMHPAVVKQLLFLKPEKIVYVSCNHPPTDLFLMKDQYKLVRSRAIDMFPQTQMLKMSYFLKRYKPMIPEVSFS